MNQLEAQYEDILHILDKLLANLGLMLEDYDVEYLTQADLYIEIFKIMFPVLEPVLNADFGEDITDEELIQYLIDILAKDIIKMDLGHIRGELIAQGDAKNILNFLQLLFEISNMVVEKDDGDKDKKNSKKNKNKRLVKSSANSADQISSSDQSSLEVNQQYNSVQGINAEFSNSSVVESNQEPSEAGAEEAYEDVQGHRVQNNKMVFDQHQQMKAMKDGASRESRSVSRISEVSKSKESSEYDRGVKKLSKDEFNPAALQVKGRAASDNGGKRGSYTSDDIRELKGEHEEEGEEEDELEEEQEESDNGYIQEQQNMAGARQFTNEEEDDGLEQEEEYYKETNEEIDEEDDGFSDHMIKKISKEEVEDDLEYYPNDPINYNPLGKNQAHQARNSQSRSHEGEGSKARAIQSVDVKHSHHMENDDEEEETPQEEYEQEEEEEDQEEEEEEQDEIVDEEEQDSQQREYYEGEYDGEGIHENDPRLAEYREEMEEVAEEEYEEEDDTENAEPNHHLYQVHQSGKKSVKGKGKGGKAKKSGTKKAVKAQPVVDYKKPKVEYRPLRPATAGMKRPQTAKPTKTTKVNKSNPVRSSGRKSNESTSSRSKKMLHSKSEKHLYVAEEQEPEQTQSEGQEDYSEDKGMEPKEYQPGDSQVPSQHGGIEEEQEYDEQEYQEQAQQIPDGNVFKILSENVMRVKENLRENRAIEDVPFDDEHTVKMIRNQKEQYKQYLKDFVKDHQMREKKYEQMRQMGAKNFQKKMRSENIRDQHLRKDFENQQKSLYFKMRDEKVNYLRRIHKTIFELEKKRIIDEKKEYMEFRKTRNIEAVNMIESIKNQYRHKLSILRENNANQQYERKIASEAQRTFIKTLENELRMDQMKEVERLKDKWRLEKERFDMMIKDEGFLEQKVMQLYKKGVF